MEEVMIGKGVLNDGRRFSLLVEGATTLLSGDGVVVSGNVHGTIKKGDEIFILMPRVKNKAHVVAIEADVDGKLAVVDEATDTRVNISLDISDVSLTKALAIITSIEPVEKFDPNVPMENSYLSGLLFEAEKYKKDKNYVSIMSYLLAHANFIAPLKVNKLEDGKTQMGFYMLPAEKAEEGQLPKSFYFPVFTDFEAMSKWTALTKENPKVPSTVMTFKNVADLIKPEPTVGFIVNPFNKNMIIIREELVKSILNSEGYKKDFPEANEENQ